tara:strand:- start:2364 stop:2549 length:186 start_codon:yes stop_codon:yes gene_type:complete
MSSTWQFKVEEIFQDIDNDTENVNMIIPKEILNKKGWSTGTELDISCNSDGTIIIKEVTSL